jgi:hypothetical protein
MSVLYQVTYNRIVQEVRSLLMTGLVVSCISRLQRRKKQPGSWDLRVSQRPDTSSLVISHRPIMACNEQRLGEKAPVVDTMLR